MVKVWRDERELNCFALIVSYGYLCSVSLPRGAWVSLWSVIVAFPDQAHLGFYKLKANRLS